MHRNFAQTVSFRCGDPAQLVAISEQWDIDQATSDIMGYMGQRILADRDDPGRYVAIADFGVVDPDVAPADEALRNNERPETHATAERMREIIDGEIEWHHYTRSTAQIDNPPLITVAVSWGHRNGLVDRVRSTGRL